MAACSSPSGQRSASPPEQGGRVMAGCRARLGIYRSGLSATPVALKAARIAMSIARSALASPILPIQLSRVVTMSAILTVESCDNGCAADASRSA